jgi:hypothetical protein
LFYCFDQRPVSSARSILIFTAVPGAISCRAAGSSGVEEGGDADGCVGREMDVEVAGENDADEVLYVGV